LFPRICSRAMRRGGLVLRLSPKDAGKKGHLWLGARRHIRLSRIAPGLRFPGAVRCPIAQCIRLFLLPISGKVLLPQVKRAPFDRPNSFQLD
jgi:hypothetical protein